MDPQNVPTIDARLAVLSRLLCLIDPVRGEPTMHSLDKHPNEDSWHHEHLQEKFLDSFALISSTSRKGRETASAVCLEQHGYSGVVLRLCRNLGVTSQVQVLLQGVLDDLRRISSQGIHFNSKMVIRNLDLDL